MHNINECTGGQMHKIRAIPCHQIKANNMLKLEFEVTPQPVFVDEDNAQQDDLTCCH
jgi:hypothetical protein